jgi:hypothetical protein
MRVDNRDGKMGKESKQDRKRTRGIERSNEIATALRKERRSLDPCRMLYLGRVGT